MQHKQKEWYDAKSRKREFQSGDQVLVLLPSTEQKLYAEWRGPFTVVEKLSPVDYLIDVGSKRKKRERYHVNVLKRYVERTENEVHEMSFVMDAPQQVGDEMACFDVVSVGDEPVALMNVDP
ncbi:unnamed protein product, partial [Ixodes persulcatus]